MQSVPQYLSQVSDYTPGSGVHPTFLVFIPLKTCGRYNKAYFSRKLKLTVFAGGYKQKAKYAEVFFS